MLRKGKTLIVLAVFLLTVPALAQDLSNTVQIHGFGAWGYGNTNGNRYQLGSDEGNYGHSQFALALSANPVKKLNIFSQLFWGSTELGERAGFDYAFGQWEFSNAAKFRIGKVKQPFGIYTEIFDVGTVRPLFALPQGIYSPQGIVAKAYSGLGIAGSYFSSQGWGLQYDVYAGKLDLEVEHPWEALAVTEEETEEEREFDSVKDVVGGRLIFNTPLSGLSFGTSAYSGTPEGGGYGGGEKAPKHVAYGIQAEYLSDVLSLRTEFARHVEGDELTLSGAYVEVGYQVTQQWQIATRYDWSKVKLGEMDLVSGAPSLLRHKELAFGLNYWFSTEFVVKLAYHIIDGNRFALPEELHEAIEDGGLDSKTKLIQFGTQFSF